MSYAITRVAKLKGGGTVAALEGHINRDKVCKSNKDIDFSLTYLNYSLIGSRDFSDLKGALKWEDIKYSASTIESLACKTFNEHADDNIKTYHNVKAKKRDGSGEYSEKSKPIRKDAVKVITAICTSDYLFFEKLTEEEEREFFEDCLQWYKDTFGEQNIFSAVVHKDERGREDKKIVPHLHITFSPILYDYNTGIGELSANQLFTNKIVMQTYQNSYYGTIGIKHGLERGEMADFQIDEKTGRIVNLNPKSKKKHTTNQEWKRANELRKEIEALEAEKLKLTEDIQALEDVREQIITETKYLEAVQFEKVKAETELEKVRKETAEHFEVEKMLLEGEKVAFKCEKENYTEFQEWKTVHKSKPEPIPESAPDAPLPSLQVLEPVTAPPVQLLSLEELEKQKEEREKARKAKVETGINNTVDFSEFLEDDTQDNGLPVLDLIDELDSY